MLMRLTDAGAKGIKQSPAAVDAAWEKWTQLGGEVLSFHRTMGEYDFVAVGTAPNDWCAMAFDAFLAGSGRVDCVTMHAIDATEWAWLLHAPDEVLRDLGSDPEPTRRKGLAPPHSAGSK
jgi:uncharacterized protein with GYD domain